MSSIHHTHCPVCGSSDINPLLTVKDHSVSQENFVLWQCSHCSLRFTQDVPDEGSIGRYYQSSDYISHTNSNKGLINKIYQLVRNYTLQQKANLIIDETVKEGRVLDIGAGIGAFLNTMKQKNWEVTGIEPDEGARQQAKALFKLEISNTDVLEHLPEHSFDAITLWHVLEHVHQLHPYVDRLKTLLKPDGKIFIAVPNYHSADSSVYKLYWAAYDVPRHLYHFAPHSVKMLMNQHGLKVISQKPMWLDAFYISLLSSKYKNKKINWIAAGFHGFQSTLATLFNREKCSSIIYIIEKN